jgi:hypothetical protein
MGPLDNAAIPAVPTPVRLRDAKRPVDVRNSASIVLDRDAVLHLVDPEDLGIAAVAAQFVVLAHDQRLIVRARVADDAALAPSSW